MILLNVLIYLFILCQLLSGEQTFKRSLVYNIKLLGFEGPKTMMDSPFGL